MVEQGGLQVGASVREVTDGSGSSRLKGWHNLLPTPHVGPTKPLPLSLSLMVKTDFLAAS